MPSGTGCWAWRQLEVYLTHTCHIFVVFHFLIVRKSLKNAQQTRRHYSIRISVSLMNMQRSLLKKNSL